MQKQVNKAIAMDLLNPYLTQEEIAERNGYDSDKKIQRFKGCMVDKIANVAKMSTEELQAVDLDFKKTIIRNSRNWKNE